MDFIFVNFENKIRTWKCEKRSTAFFREVKRIERNFFVVSFVLAVSQSSWKTRSLFPLPDNTRHQSLISSTIDCEVFLMLCIKGSTKEWNINVQYLYMLHFVYCYRTFCAMTRILHHRDTRMKNQEFSILNFSKKTL